MITSRIGLIAFVAMVAFCCFVNSAQSSPLQEVIQEANYQMAKAMPASPKQNMQRNVAADNGTLCFNQEVYPSPGANMATCCWYSSSTCCVGFGGVLTTTILASVLDYVDNITTSATCKSAIAAYLCESCDPNSGVYTAENEEETIITVCGSYCDTFYAACKDIPEIAGNFSSSAQFCEALGGGGEQGKNISINVASSNKNCFGGQFGTSSSINNVVTSSQCVPWTLTESHQQESSNGDGGNGKKGNGTTILIIVLCILAAIVVAAVVGVAGFFGYRKFRRSQAPTYT